MKSLQEILSLVGEAKILDWIAEAEQTYREGRKAIDHPNREEFIESYCNTAYEEMVKVREKRSGQSRFNWVRSL